MPADDLRHRALPAFSATGPSVELLTAAEEIDLARTIEVGVLAAELLRDPGVAVAAGAGATADELGRLVGDGRRARRRFVEANLRLVHLVARQASVRAGGLDPADLHQEGCLGLITAVERFDHRRGCRFATYALYWIRAYVREATATRLGELNVPVGRAAELRTVRGMAEAVNQQLGRRASAAEVAAAVGRSVDWTEKLLNTRPTLSLDGLAPEEATAIVGPAAIADPLDDDRRDRLVTQLLAQLPELERSVIALRSGFGTEPLGYAAIARRLAINVTRVRRLEHSALERLQGVCPVAAREHLSA